MNERSPVWRILSALVAAGLLAAFLNVAESPNPTRVSFQRRPDRIVVRLGGKPFTEYVFSGHVKPILFPIIGPGGVPMTRSWPIVKGVPDEPHDHPHHESLWFMHGDVNGVDFWAHKPDEAGRLPEVRQTAIEISEPDGTIESQNEWRRPDGTVVMTDARRLRFWAEGVPGAAGSSARGIDYDITLRADRGKVVLGDTKEGTMAIRVHHALQLEDLDGSKGAAGTVVNSEGERDAAAWGRPARWVDYSGAIEGKPVGIAVFDHPDNLRHPTRWHARGYGLFAANPFGLHDFAGEPRGSGSHTIADGGTLRLRYRFVFHEDDAEAAGLERRWRDWAGGDSP